MVLVLGVAAMLPVGPTGAQSGAEVCFPDAGGDAVDGGSGATVEAGAADVTEVCVTVGGETVGFTATVAEPSDPASAPEWEMFGSSVALFLDNGWTLQLGTATAPGVFEAYAFDPSGALVCQEPATFDGTSYAGMVAATCAGSPQRVRVTAQVVSDGDAELPLASGRVDLAPDAGASLAIPAAPPQIRRLFGAERIATALEISRDLWAAGGADGVVLARADDFADALAGAQLAAALPGPLLLTPADEIPGEVQAEVARVLGGVGAVTLLGGTAALGEAVAMQLEQAGHTVGRIAGATRYATAVAAATASDPEPEVILLATGNAFPEALAAGATARSGGGTMVLTDAGILPAEVRAYLDAHAGVPVFAVGPDAAAAAPEAQPLAGEDAYATAALLAAGFAQPTRVVIASGERFPDALAGGAYAARLGIPLLLATQAALPAPSMAYLEAGDWEEAILLGGDAALGFAVAEQVADALEERAVEVTSERRITWRRRLLGMAGAGAAGAVLPAPVGPPRRRRRPGLHRRGAGQQDQHPALHAAGGHQRRHADGAAAAGRNHSHRRARGVRQHRRRDRVPPGTRRRRHTRRTSGHMTIPHPYDDAAWRQTVQDALVVGQRFVVAPGKSGGGNTGPFGRLRQTMNTAAAVAVSEGLLGMGPHDHEAEFQPVDDDPELWPVDLYMAGTDPTSCTGRWTSAGAGRRRATRPPSSPATPGGSASSTSRT